MKNWPRRFLILFASAPLVLACDFKQSTIDKLKLENDSLSQVIVKNQVQLQNVRLVNTEIKELTSQYTSEAYDIYISYPSDYKTSNRKYPLLVVLDAEVNFGAATYITQRLKKDELIPELFVVGIAYKGETDETTYYAIRGRDFTPTSDTIRHLKLGTGGAEDFVKFISLELFPFLRNNYPIQDQGKTLYGHSFGGLFGTHVLLNHTALFDNYLLLSPSLWWNDRHIFKNAKLNSFAGLLKLYMATGAREGKMVSDQIEMINQLKRSDAGRIISKSEILSQETHRTVFGRGFTNGLRFIYSKE